MNAPHDPITEPNGPPAADPANQTVDGAAADITPDGPEDVETLQRELAELSQKADEYLRLAQRSQADFINYRRRVEEERAQQARDANVTYLLRLLPILDDFERALANAAPEDLESNWGKGVLLVERNVRSLLAADGVERLPAEGAEFDPREHEALGRQPSSDVPDGHVLHVVRPGYRKGDRVIRPAQVIVAAPPSG
ncbi:MAG TPA: nucleotide exchange factor GrpE [Chloroflexota bacterium]|jgi:molecular chaperone GrpE